MAGLLTPKNDSNTSQTSGTILKDMDRIRKPFYQKFLDELEAYDFQPGETMREYYDGLFGIPTPGGQSHKYVCWKSPLMVTQRLTRWDLEDGYVGACTGGKKEAGDCKFDPNYYGRPPEEHLDRAVKLPSILGSIQTKVAGDNKSDIMWDKLLYCLTFKLFMFPLAHVLMLCLRFLYIFRGIISIPFKTSFAAIGNILLFVPFINVLLLPHIDPEYGGFTYNYKSVKEDGKVVTKTKKANPADILKAYIGIALPYGKWNKKFGDKYGTGGLFWIILSLMAISAIVIFVGGSSIIVAFIGFFMYCTKVIRALSDFSVNKTEEGGKASENKK